LTGVHQRLFVWGWLALHLLRHHAGKDGRFKPGHDELTDRHESGFMPTGISPNFAAGTGGQEVSVGFEAAGG
jgi:hypothetical protein